MCFPKCLDHHFGRDISHIFQFVFARVKTIIEPVSHDRESCEEERLDQRLPSGDICRIERGNTQQVSGELLVVDLWCFCQSGLPVVDLLGKSFFREIKYPKEEQKCNSVDEKCKKFHSEKCDDNTQKEGYQKEIE